MKHAADELYASLVPAFKARRTTHFGFTRVPRRMVEKLTPSERARSATVVGTFEEQFKLIKPAWPNVVPPERVNTDASLIAGAAARMELAVLSIN